LIIDRRFCFINSANSNELYCLVLKAILYYCCRGVPVETIKALAHDHRNDVLSNCVALISGLFGKICHRFLMDVLLNSLFSWPSYFTTY